MPSNKPIAAMTDRCQADEPPPCLVLRQRSLGRLRRFLLAVLAASVWCYLAAVLAVWMLLHYGGDRWWPATVMLYSPGWLYAVPWPVLALAAALTRRRLLRPLAAAALVLAVPIAGLCLPWARLVGQEGPALRVITCNIDGSALDAKRFWALVAEARPDVVALQECPADVLADWPPEWQVSRAGGLLIASPHPLRDVERSLRRHPPSQWPAVNGLRCSVETPLGTVRFCCVHLRTPRHGLSETLDRRTGVSLSRSATLTAAIADRWLETEELAAWLEDFGEPLIVAGDFNMPTHSTIYREYWSSYANAFSRAGFGFGYSKWTQIGKLNYGTRIDHILTSAGLQPRRCWLGPDVGSDHLPLLAEVAW